MKIDSEILCSFIDGELDEQKAQAVRAALETDQTLRREYEGLQKTAQLVRSLPRVSAPPELAATITAHAERSQLLGPTQQSQSRASRFRWTLSMAASLLVGASLGILGYRAWPSLVAPSLAPAESAIVTGADDYEAKDSSGIVLAPKAAPSAKLGLDYRADAGEPSEQAGEETAAGLPIHSAKTGRSAKGGVRISRSGPATGSPSKSFRGGFGESADQIVTNGRSVETEQLQEELAQFIV